MKLFLIVLCIFSFFVLGEESSAFMYCSDDSESVRPYDDLADFYQTAESLDEEELVQHLRKIIHFPLRYLVIEEGIMRNIPSEKFEEFITGIYGRQLIQHFRESSQEEHKSVYELKMHFSCDSLENRYGISSLSFVRRPEFEERSLMELFQGVFVPFVSSAQTKYLLGDEDLSCT